MKSYGNIYGKLCSLDNLLDAYTKAKRGKSSYKAVLEFEEHWQLNLLSLHQELKDETYKPKPLERFILRDPKTREICVSDFRDRIVHHALVNIIQPIFEPRFIYDSYASRKGKGVHQAISRLDEFMRSCSKNGRLIVFAENSNQVRCYVLKADIYHYFESIDHHILMNIIFRRIRDEKLMSLMKKVLSNYDSGTIGKGMPLGNWTSQFLANVYLDGLDQFIKHILKAKYYLRYVDDFVILHKSRKELEDYQSAISTYLSTLGLKLHPQKTKIFPAGRGIDFLGFKSFYHHRLVRTRNLRNIKSRLSSQISDYKNGLSEWSLVIETFNGWQSYAMHADSFNQRKRMSRWLNESLRLASIGRICH